MEVCDYCGQYAEVRKIFGSNHINFWALSIGPLSYYDYICEKCSKAKDLIYKIEEDIAIKEAKEKQAIWIKARDKLLKEDK